MKKRVLSSLKSKVPRAKHASSPSRRSIRSRPSRSLPKTARPQARLSAAHLSTAASAPGPSDNLSQSTVDYSPLSQDTIQTDSQSTQEPVSLLPETELTIRDDLRKRRTMMWVGVSVSMLVIVVGWVWTLRYSLTVPAISSDSTLPVRAAEDNLTTLFEKVNRSLDELTNSSVPPRVEAPPSSLPLVKDLTPEQIELLKQKINESAAAPPKTP